MNFVPERSINLRNSFGINKAEAARRLNMSAMGYGRYEKGEREPSFQTVTYIAQVFGSSADYLYGQTDDMSAKEYVVSVDSNPVLFELVKNVKDDEKLLKRVAAYAEKLCKE